MNDLADRPPRPTSDDELVDLGGKSVRIIATPHVPHGWEAEGLVRGDDEDIVLRRPLHTPGQWTAVDARGHRRAGAGRRKAFHATSIGVATVPTIRRLAELKPDRLALMHGSSFEGDASGQLTKLADAYEMLAASGRFPPIADNGANRHADAVKIRSEIAGDEAAISRLITTAFLEAEHTGRAPEWCCKSGWWNLRWRD